jgi:hypothetical protein
MYVDMVTRQVSIDELKVNPNPPRSMEWKYPHLIDMDNLDEDRFICTEERFPWTKIMYTEGIRQKNLERAIKRVENRDWDEVAQFRPIITDENQNVISGFKVLQIFKMAGMRSVQIHEIHGLNDWEKWEMILADSDNFNQQNWTPNLPRFHHEIVANFRDN